MRSARSQCSRTHHFWRVAGALLIVLIMFAVSACISFRSEDAGSDSDESPTPTRPASTAESRIPTTLASSVVPIHPVSDPEELLGSAIVLSADGLLITSTSVVDGEIEVVLPDSSRHRPAVVSTEPSTGLALLQVPADDLTPIEFSTERLTADSEVFATGYDGAPESLGRISGTVTESHEPDEENDYRVRGALRYETDMHLIGGFLGGALSNGNGGFCGILVPGESDSGEQTFDVISHWFVMAWLQSRENQLATVQEQSGEWETIALPGDWSIQAPADWNLSVPADSDDAYRAELTPTDPDVPLQLAISVEANEYGTDADTFIADVFADRSTARIWRVDRAQDSPLVRATISQEGALVDVAYLLNEERLIAVSLTSGYQPESDQSQVDEARALFDVVVGSIARD